MTRVYLACDESGAKGYADRDESFPGEVGVFAGVLVPEEMIDDVSAHFDSIRESYLSAPSKVHIADLQPEQKQSLRTRIFEGIRQFKLPCFWYAIHVAGLHHAHRVERDLFAQAKQVAGTSPRFRVNVRHPPRSLHVELFAGLYSRLVAFLMERGQNDVEIEILSDPIDRPILEAFRASANDLLDDSPDETETTGWDTVNREVVAGRIVVDFALPPEWDLGIKVSKLTIAVSESHKGIVLAADVLSNSLSHHFKQRTAGELYRPLNQPAAINGHPLMNQLCVFSDWGEETDPGDTFFRHPNTIAE